jgi:hypothetical protein
MTASSQDISMSFPESKNASHTSGLNHMIQRDNEARKLDHMVKPADMGPLVQQDVFFSERKEIAAEYIFGRILPITNGCGTRAARDICFAYRAKRPSIAFSGGTAPRYCKSQHRMPISQRSAKTFPGRGRRVGDGNGRGSHHRTARNGR